VQVPIRTPVPAPALLIVYHVLTARGAVVSIHGTLRYPTLPFKAIRLYA